MLNHLQQMQYHIAELQRQTGSQDRFGTVKEVQGDRIKVSYGLKQDGSELISPWLDTADHRGGNSERHNYEKGQNVRVSAIAGSFRNGSVSHWAPNDSHPPPAHADDVNGHSGQTGKSAFAFNKAAQQQGGGGGGQGGGGGGAGGQEDYGELMIFKDAPQNPQHQDSTGQFEQGGGSQGGQQQGGQQKQKPEAAMKSRLSEKGFITHRVGKNVRVAVSDKEAMVMWGESGENTVFCDDEGCHSTKPLTIKKPKSKLDNA